MTDQSRTKAELIAELATLREQLSLLQETLASQSQADRQLEIILRDVADGITAQDATGRLIYANDAAARLNGYPSAEAMLAAPVAEMIKKFEITDEHGQPLPLSQLPGRLALMGLPGPETIVRFRVVETGEERWSVVKATPVFDEQGKVQFAINIFRDFTARKQFEDNLRFLTEASTLLASSLDYETTLQQVARLAVPQLADWCVVDILEERLAGDDSTHRVAVAHADPTKVEWAAEFQRRYPTDLNAPHGVARVLRTGQPELAPDIQDAMLEFIARDAEHLRMLRELGMRSAMIVPLVVQGRVLGAISLVSTISGRHYTADDLALAEELARRAAVAVENARLYEEAQRAIMLRDQFLSIAAHELKTPITALKGYAGLLQRMAGTDSMLNERSRRGLDIIQQETTRLNRLVDLLLDISRIQSGRLELDQQPVDLVALAQRLERITGATLTQHTLNLVHSSEPLLVLGDELRLEQVLHNLLSNAIKYSPEGGLVTIRVERRAERAAIVVSDEGIGIPPNELDLLFSRFYRAANVQVHQISGMGLGLYLVKEIVTLHGGTIEVTSREGEGSSFCVYLPLLEEGQPEPGAAG